MTTVNWRTRAIIRLHAGLSTDPFLINNHTVTSQPHLRSNDWPSQIHIVDVSMSLSVETPAKEAHVQGINTLNRFLDRVSLAAYSPSQILKLISTCPASVRVGEEFVLITADLVQEIESPTVKPEHIANFEELGGDSILHEAVHHTRKALTSDAAEHHLLNLYVAAERVATSESDERVKYSCDACGHEKEGPIASRRAVRTFLKTRAVSRKDCDDSSEYRNKVAHGGGKRDVGFYERVTKLAGAVEAAVISNIAERTKVQVLRRMGVVVGLPMTVHTAKAEPDGAFILLDTAWQAPMRFPALGDDVSSGGGSVMAGFPTDANQNPKIDPVAWPVILPT